MTVEKDYAVSDVIVRGLNVVIVAGRPYNGKSPMAIQLLSNYRYQIPTGEVVHLAAEESIDALKNLDHIL